MNKKHAYAIASIDGVSYGMRDFPDERPGLWFGVSWDGGGSGALIAMQHEEANRFIAENQIYSTDHLEGRQCVIDAPGSGACLVTFVCLLKE